MDTTLTIQRVVNALDTTFGGLIDISDVANHPEEQQRDNFLTRALAAFCVRGLTDCSPAEAAASVTDSYGDQGLDAIFFEPNERCIYIVQSKWSQKSQKTIELGDMEKFLKGVQFLITPDFSGFGEKVKKRESELSSLLLRSDVNVCLVVAHTSPQPLGVHVSNSLGSFLQAQNNVGDLDPFKSEIFDLKRVYAGLAGSGTGVKTDVQISLRSWGTIEEPYRAYYGRVLVSDIAGWSKHGRVLFDKNLRYFRPTEINAAIEATLADSPENFWYFNNGITILASSVEKALIGGNKSDFGLFDCKGVSIVNGAQTVGVIWELAKKNELYISTTSACVQARIISLENCPDGFGTRVTTAANTQNPIRHRDFAALDPEQHRLAHEISLDGKRYAFKSGDPDPKPDEGCNIEEATIALACANDEIGLAVQAKREVGQLWQDITKAPYTTLFNSQLSATTMWRSVLVMRAVEAALGEFHKESIPRGELVAVHGNRFILHRVFMDPSVKAYKDPNMTEQQIADLASASTADVLTKLASLISKLYSAAYLANLFKNVQKNKDLNKRMAEADLPPVGETMNMFDPKSE